jgi:hypothetical protein
VFVKGRLATVDLKERHLEVTLLVEGAVELSGGGRRDILGAVGTKG